MNSLQRMQIFEKDCDKDVKIVDEFLGKGHPSLPKILYKKEAVLSKFREKYGEKLSNYVDVSMTAMELTLYEKAYLLHEDNPKRLSELRLTQSQLSQMVKGFCYKLDLAEEIIAGISDEDLDNLLKILEKGYELRELFTEDGAFIDYEKIKNVLKG